MHRTIQLLNYGDECYVGAHITDVNQMEGNKECEMKIYEWFVRLKRETFVTITQDLN